MVDYKSSNIYNLSHLDDDSANKVRTLNNTTESFSQKQNSNDGHCGDFVNGRGFCNGDPGYLIKASTVNSTNDVVINIHTSTNGIRKPVRKTGDESRWEVPHRLQEVGVSDGVKVFNLYIHPGAYEMSTTNPSLRDAIAELSLKSLKKEYGIYATESQMHCNGISVSEAGGTDDEMSGNDEPVDKIQTESSKKSRRSRARRKNRKSNHVVPEYHVSYPDDDTGENPSNMLEVSVKLPLLRSFSSVSVNVHEKRLIITTSKESVVYRLDLDLPDPVNRNGKQVKYLRANHHHPPSIMICH